MSIIFSQLGCWQTGLFMALEVWLVCICFVALPEAWCVGDPPPSLANGTTHRPISGQWAEAGNKCMCTNNNATRQTGWYRQRAWWVHNRCLQNLHLEQNQPLIGHFCGLTFTILRVVATYSSSHKAIENQSKQRHTSSFLVFTKCTISKNALTLKVQRR